MKRILMLFLIWAFLCGSSWSLTSAYHPSSQADIERVLLGVNWLDKIDVDMKAHVLKGWCTEEDFGKWKYQALMSYNPAGCVWEDGNAELYRNNINWRIKIVKLYHGNKLAYQYNAGKKVWPSHYDE